VAERGLTGARPGLPSVGAGPVSGGRADPPSGGRAGAGHRPGGRV